MKAVGIVHVADRHLAPAAEKCAGRRRRTPLGDYEFDLAAERGGERLKRSIGGIRLAALKSCYLALVGACLLSKLLLRPAPLPPGLGELAGETEAFAAAQQPLRALRLCLSLQLGHEIGELGRHHSSRTHLEIGIRPISSAGPSAPLSRLPVLGQIAVRVTKHRKRILAVSAGSGLALFPFRASTWAAS